MSRRKKIITEEEMEARLKDFATDVQDAAWHLRRFYVDVYHYCLGMDKREQEYVIKIWPELLIRGLVCFRWRELRLIYIKMANIMNRYNTGPEQAAALYIKERAKNGPLGRN